MLTARQLVNRAALLKELQRRNREQWPLPPDLALQFPRPMFRSDGTPAPARPPAPCLPLVRTAVPVALTPAQQLDLHAAIVTATDPSPRLRTFDREWHCLYDTSRVRAALGRTEWQRQAWEKYQHLSTRFLVEVDRFRASGQIEQGANQ
ncbi:hypothetical protein [Nocardia farcinica]